MFVVVDDENHARLPIGTRLEEVRRFERWEYPHCIPTIRSLVIELKVLDGQQSGALIDEVLAQGYEDRPPWSDWPNWLDRTSVDYECMDT
jgi:hypothetical protein